MRPRWPIGFRRNYHLLSYFLPGLFMSISHPIPRCRKNLSSFFSPREISPGLARSSRLWRVPNRRILHSGLIPPCFDLCFHFLRIPSLSLSRFLSCSFIFWTLSFHLPFSRIVLLLAFFFLPFSLPCQEFILFIISFRLLPCLISYLFFSRYGSQKKSCYPHFATPERRKQRPKKMALRDYT